MNALTRQEGAPGADPRQTAESMYLDLPAAQAGWRLSQLRDAGVQPAEVTFDAGRMRLGPLSPEEYEAAWAAMRAANRPRERGVEFLWNALLVVIIAVGILWGGTLVAPFLAIGALVVMAGVCLLMIISDARSMTASARLGRRHPNPVTRDWARRVWWMPSCGAVGLVLAVLAVFGAAIALAMAIGGGL